MGNKVLIQHHTKYQYDRLVYLSPHYIRLRPAAHCRVPIEKYTLTVKPENHYLHWQQDPFGNFVARIDFKEQVRELVIEVKIAASIEPVNPFDFFLDDDAQVYPFQYNDQLKKDLTPYLEIVDAGPGITSWLQLVDKSPKGIIDFLIMINKMVFSHIGYNTRIEPGVQSSDDTLQLLTGSCRDTGWLLVQVLRHLGLAARFASGYLVQLAENPVSMSSKEKDSVELHAWAEVFIPGAGWIGLDPTSGMFAGQGHIPLSCTPGIAAAAPITGTSDVANTTFSYNSTVIRLAGK